MITVKLLQQLKCSKSDIDFFVRNKLIGFPLNLVEKVNHSIFGNIHLYLSAIEYDDRGNVKKVHRYNKGKIQYTVEYQYDHLDRALFTATSYYDDDYPKSIRDIVMSNIYDDHGNIVQKNIFRRPDPSQSFICVETKNYSYNKDNKLVTCTNKCDDPILTFAYDKFCNVKLRIDHTIDQISEYYYEYNHHGDIVYCRESIDSKVKSNSEDMTVVIYKP